MADLNKLSEKTPENELKKHIGLKASRTIGNTAIYILLVIMTIIWLIPFVCIVLQSFRCESTYIVGYVIPKVWGLDNYKALFQTDFPIWYRCAFPSCRRSSCSA